MLSGATAPATAYVVEIYYTATPAALLSRKGSPRVWGIGQLKIQLNRNESLVAAPDLSEIQNEPFNRPRPRHGPSGLDPLLLIPLVNGHLPRGRIDQPCQINAIRNPSAHLLGGSRHAIALRPQFDHERRSQPQKSPHLLAREPRHLCRSGVCCVGTQHRSI